MSVLIKGMEIPKEGYVDVRLFSDGRATTQTGEYPFYREMEITNVIEPHGRLIDADALLSQYKGNIWTAKTDYAEGLRDVANDIKQAPTIIEAEEEQE